MPEAAVDELGAEADEGEQEEFPHDWSVTARTKSIRIKLVYFRCDNQDERLRVLGA